MSVRPSDRRVEGKLAREYRGPPWRATGTEVPRAPKKKCTPAADRRARTKRREKNISAGAKARERKKNHFGGSEEKYYLSNVRPCECDGYQGPTREKKKNIGFFESECIRPKIFFESECKKTKNT
jgi:hypothetical protein